MCAIANAIASFVSSLDVSSNLCPILLPSTTHLCCQRLHHLLGFCTTLQSSQIHQWLCFLRALQFRTQVQPYHETYCACAAVWCCCLRRGVLRTRLLSMRRIGKSMLGFIDKTIMPSDVWGVHEWPKVQRRNRSIIVCRVENLLQLRHH